MHKYHAVTTATAAALHLTASPMALLVCAIATTLAPCYSMSHILCPAHYFVWKPPGRQIDVRALVHCRAVHSWGVWERKRQYRLLAHALCSQDG